MPGPDAGTAQRLGGPWPRTHTQGEEALVRARTPAPAARRPAGCLPPRPARRTQARRADPRLARCGGVAPERVGGADHGRAGLSAGPRAQPERPTGKLRARAGWAEVGSQPVTWVARFLLAELRQLRARLASWNLSGELAKVMCP